MNFLTKNFQLKILALFSAIILWFFVVGIENTVYLFPEDLEIQTQNLPSNLNFSAPLGKVKIRVRADSGVVKNLTKNDFEISIDLKDFEAGEYTLPLSAKSNNDKVTILRVEPPTIHFKLQSVEEKEVKIKALLNGNPKNGFIVKEVKLDQQTAKISGIKDLLAQINEVDAEIKFDGTQTSDFSQNVKLEIPKNIGEKGKNITIIPDQINVTVSLVPDQSSNNLENDTNLQTTEQEKVVAVKPKIQGKLNPDQQVEVIPFTVAIKGNYEDLKNINFLETESIQSSTLMGSSKPLKVKLVIPPKISLVNFAEAQVTISLKVSNSANPPSF